MGNCFGRTSEKHTARLKPSKPDKKDIALSHISHESNPTFQQQSSQLVTLSTSLKVSDQRAEILPAERVLSHLHVSKQGDLKEGADALYESGILNIGIGKYEAASTQLKSAYKVLSDVYDVEVSLNHDSPGIIGGVKASIMSDGYHFTSSSGLEFFRGDSAELNNAGSSSEAGLDSIQAITDHKILYKIGLNLSRKGEYKEAITYYQKAILLSGSNSEHYKNAIAFNYYLLKDLIQAKECCQNILEFTPEYGPAHATLSYIYQDEAEAAREEGMELAERDYFKKAIEELLISKKYEKVTIKSKESYRNNVEIGVALLKSGDLERAQIYLKKAETFLKEKQKAVAATITPESAAQYAQHKKDLDYVKELQSCCIKVKAPPSPSVVSSGISGSDISDNVLSTESNSLSLVRKAADGFRLGVSISTFKAEMKAAMDNMVRREEVSIAIARNENEKYLIKQQADIHIDPKLKEYYDAFRSMLIITYSSAQAVEGNQVELDTGGLLQRGFNMALGCIPLVGNALSTISEIGENLYNAAQIHKNAKLFLHLAPTIGEFEAIITQLASDVTLHPNKRDAILFLHEEPKVKGLLSNIIAKCKSVKASIDKAFEGGELYKTDHAKLGVEDAMQVIENFLKYAAKLPAFANKDEVVKYLKHSLIPEEHWVLTQTDVSTIVHTHIVEHSLVGDRVTDKTHTSSIHQASYDGGEYVERPLIEPSVISTEM